MRQEAHSGSTSKAKLWHNTKLSKLLEGLFYSSLFISVCAYALTIETYKLAELPVSGSMALFVFLATLFTYNLSSVYSVLRNPNQPAYSANAPWSQRHKKELAALGITSIAAGVIVFFWHNLQINGWLMAHLALISIGYTVPMVYKRRKIRPLRSIPLLKVFLIAYVWAVVTALFPLLDAGYEIWQPAPLMLFGRRFLFILALALLFDIRDFSYDRNMNTLTIPGLIGITKTKLVSLGLLVLYVFIAWQTENGWVQLALILSAVAAGAVVWYSTENKPRIYYLLLADGAMLFHAILVYLAVSGSELAA